jgi:hypothetical protein
MAQRILFSARYDHRWPQGAETHYPAGWSGLVKDEVAAAAIAAGKAERTAEPTAEMEALPSNFMQLQAIARAEEIELGEANTVSAAQAVIMSARRVKKETEGGESAALPEGQKSE